MKTVLLRTSTALALLLGLALGAVETAHAAGPAGTIYYQTTNVPPVFNAVKGDGSGQTANVLPNLLSLTDATAISLLYPSYHPYGSDAINDRWWIAPLPTGETYDEVHYAGGSIGYNVPHHDLYAVRTNPANRSQYLTVQLTDLFGIVLFAKGGECAWSNDSNDTAASFIDGAWAYDIRNAIDTSTGTTILDATQWVRCTVTLPVTASEINSSFIPFGPLSATETEIAAAIWEPAHGPADYQDAFSPDGSQYLSLTNAQSLIVNTASGAVARTLWTFNVTLGWGQWSPSGASVALNDVMSPGTAIGGGSIWTQPSSGSASPKKVLSSRVSGSTTTTYSHPIWSPDSKYLAVFKTQWSGTTVSGGWITTLNLSTGKATDIVQVPSPNGGVNVALRWVADN